MRSSSACGGRAGGSPRRSGPPRPAPPRAPRGTVNPRASRATPAGRTGRGRHAPHPLAPRLRRPRKRMTLISPADALAPSDPSIPLLRVEDLRVNYRSGRDEVEAVRGVDVTVEAGSIVALVG